MVGTLKKEESMYNVLLTVLKNRDAKASNPVFIALIIVGFIVKIGLSNTFSTDGSVGPANAVLWGYSLVLFSILGIILININTSSNNWSSVMTLPWTLFGTIILLLWTISLNIKYFTTINKNGAPAQYYTWSSYSTILFIALIFVSIFQYVLVSVNSTSETINRAKEYAIQLALYAYMLAFLNLISITFMQIILDCFTVDN